jgi:uncharacterized protein
MSKSTPSVETLFAEAEHRISCYQLTRESTVPDSRIEEIVNFVVKHAPSSFNVQSARVVVLLKEEHDALWNIANEVSKSSHPEAYDKMLGKMISGFGAAYGSILFLEDQDSLQALANKNPLFGHLVVRLQSRLHQKNIH